MSNSNSILYFVSQAYRQVQLSVKKGSAPYSYGDFNKQFQELFQTSGDEEYTKDRTILLVEEAGRQNQTTDYLRQGMEVEIRSAATGESNNSEAYSATDFNANPSGDLSARRTARRSS